MDGFLSDSEPVSSQLRREAAQAGRDLAHERSALGSEFWNEDADEGAGCGLDEQSDDQFARRVAKQERDNYLRRSVVGSLDLAAALLLLLQLCVNL